MDIQNISLSEIKRDEEQPRKYFDEEALERLKQSILDNGIEVPITVRAGDSGYIIVDGERRFRAAMNAGIKSIPCIISEKENVKAQQLRSDCLKEGLTPDELDKAIYAYYQAMQQTSLPHSSRVNKNTNPYTKIISEQIGKSDVRIQIAIDRFEFKNNNKEFMDEIQEKYNPKHEKYSNVDSTIAITKKLKNTPEVRKAIVKEVLENRVTKSKFGDGLNNDKIKKYVAEIAERKITSPQDAVNVIRDLSIKEDKTALFKSDPRKVLTDLYYEFSAFVEKFDGYEFGHPDVKKMLRGELLSKFSEKAENFLITLQNMGA